MFTHKTTLIIPSRNKSSKLIKNIIKLKIIFNKIIIIDSADNHHIEKIITFLTKKIKFQRIKKSKLVKLFDIGL
jgi:hypothetical protein